MSKNEEIKLTVNNLFFEGVTMSKDSFIQILQYALDKDFVTVQKEKANI